MAAIFACIVQPKVIEFNVSDQKLHRAQKDEELRSELEGLKLAPSEGAPVGADAAAAGATAHWPGQGEVGQVLMCPPGGGCRLLSRSASVSIASVGTAVCVFEGALINAGTLAEDYAPVPEDEPTPVPTALTSAELMCHLYAKVGVEMLGLLRGSFTFVLYESKTSRVLAARDGGGRCPLFQARTGRGSLVVTNSAALLDASGCSEKLEFQPGEFKYGWSAMPRRYQPADHTRLTRRSLDMPGAAHPHHQQHPHHHHHHHHQGNHFHSGSRNGSRRTSLDHHQHHPEASPAAAAADGNGAQQQQGGGGGRNNHHNQHHNRNQHLANGGGSGSPPPPQQQHTQSQSPGPGPHRTYVVSADDARIVKAAQARQQQQQQLPASPAPVGSAAGAAAVAAAAVVSPAGTWTASAPASRAGKDKSSESGSGSGQGQGQGQGQGRGGSARGGSSAHHNRRRSLEAHGAWRLGSGQGVSAAAGDKPQQQQQSGSGQEHHQPPQQQQQTGPKQQQQQGQKQQQGQQNGTPNGGRQRGRDGRQSLEGRAPTKQQQQGQQKEGQGAVEAVAPAPATSAAGGPTATGAALLRVDAPEFVCNRSAATAAVPVVATAVVSAP